MARRYVILGASAAGIAAAARLRELDSAAIITVVGDEPDYAYYRPLLPYLIDGRKTLEDILFHPGEWYARERIRLILDAGAHRIERDNRVVELEDGRRLDYDALLLATGASSRIPDLPGVKARGAYPLRTVADARAISAKAGECGRAVLLGGGLVSLKTAEPLLNLGLQLTFVVASPQPLSRVVDGEVGRMVADRLRELGCTLLLGRDAAQILEDERGEVSGVVLDTGETLECGLVILGKGVAPNLRMPERSDLACARGVQAGRFLETNDPVVYAAGDCVETLDVVTGGRQVAALWTNAVNMARIAATNMVQGTVKSFPGVIGTMNAGVVAGLPIVALGLTDPVGEGYQATVSQRAAEGRTTGGYRGPVYRKLVFRDDRLVGAIFCGDVSQAGVYRSFIETGAPLGSSLRTAAQEGSLTYADVQTRGRTPAYANFA
jgi:NAD(P)H-nitrite reductase large subunit